MQEDSGHRQLKLTTGLCAYIQHRGTSKGGHYNAVVKPPGSNAWVCLDDSKRCVIDPGHSDASGGAGSISAAGPVSPWTPYIFFYRQTEDCVGAVNAIAAASAAMKATSDATSSRQNRSGGPASFLPDTVSVIAHFLHHNSRCAGTLQGDNTSAFSATFKRPTVCSALTVTSSEQTKAQQRGAAVKTSNSHIDEEQGKRRIHWCWMSPLM
jgi:hypothetical protein